MYDLLNNWHCKFMTRKCKTYSCDKGHDHVYFGNWINSSFNCSNEGLSDFLLRCLVATLTIKLMKLFEKIVNSNRYLLAL